MRSRSGVDPKNANRADAARSRRTQRSQQRVSQVSERATRPERSRPVTVRGNTFGTPIHRKAGTQRARRQFYLTMDQAGSELRLPAIALANPGWRLMSALLAILAVVGIYSMWSSPYFSIAAVEVNGLQRLSPDDLTAALHLENLSIIEIDRQAVLETLTGSFPELVDINVGVFMPNFVTISAAERQPVLAWQTGEQVSWVDEEGIIFPARGEAEVAVTIHSTSDLPLAALPVDLLLQAQDSDAEPTGEEAQPGLFGITAGGSEPGAQKNIALKADPMLITAAQELRQILPAETAILYDPVNGLGWDDPLGWQVYIGRDLTDYEAKYASYQKIAAFLMEQGLRPTLVSVEHLNAPFYRLEQ